MLASKKPLVTGRVEEEFGEVPLNGVLRSWLRGSAGGIMLVVEGDIPLSLKRKSPVVDLTKGKESMR